MDIKIIRAVPEDAEQLIAVQDAAFYADYGKYGECPGYGRTRESMLGSIENADTYKIVAEGRIVGDIILRKVAENEYYLGCLCVKPEYEGRGIGQQAMAFIDSVYTDAKKWTLKTPADNGRNHAFYKKCGFAVTDTQMDGNVEIVIFTRIK